MLVAGYWMPDAVARVADPERESLCKMYVPEYGCRTP